MSKSALLSAGSNEKAAPLITAKVSGGGGDPGKPAIVKNKLDLCNGVFVPVTLNILGVILFLKLGWGTGNAGIVGMVLVFLIAETICVMTVLSLSAIVTNGAMSGGGAYFMISRSLGPEFGGAIGTLFYLANSFGASFYFIGFAEGIALFDVVKKYICEYRSSTETGFCLADANFNRLCGIVCLIACFIVSWVGASAFTKVNIPLFVIMLGSILVGLFSYLVPAEANLGVHSTMVPACQAEANVTDLSQCEYNMINYTYTGDVVGLGNSTGNYFAENWAMPDGTTKLWPCVNSAGFFFFSRTCLLPFFLSCRRRRRRCRQRRAARRRPSPPSFYFVLCWRCWCSAFALL
jgi:hypothetical protein